MKKKKVQVNLFFDESGKKNDRPTIMGGLFIPQSLYNTDDFINFSSQLRNKKLKLHWNRYSGYQYQKENIIEVISTLMKYYTMFKFNVINYTKLL